MTNSIITTVVEVTKNIHHSYNGLMTANDTSFYVKRKTLTGYDVLVYVKMS